MKTIIKRAVRRVFSKAVHYRIAEVYRSFRRKSFSAHVIERDFRGHLLRIHIDDGLAAAWYECKWDGAPPEFALLERYSLREGAKVFDIGAHQAVVALMLARVVGPSGQVVAVEADPWNATIAHKNQQLNQQANLVVLHAAAGESDGVPFPHVEREIGDRVFEWSQHRIAFRTIDSLAREFGKPNVVYCDVDGFEASVLRGAVATLSDRVDWFVEIHVGCGLEAEGSSWQQIIDFFPSERFDRYIASEGMQAFVPFVADSPILKQRFFFVAIHRK